MLKEQLQALWGERTFDLMIAELDSWCQLAKRRGSYLSSTLQTRFRREDLGSAIMQTIG